MKENRKNVKVITRYSEALKAKVAEEVGNGQLTPREAAKHYGVKNVRTVTGWVRQYGYRDYETKVVRIMMKSEQERIKELEEALADERLRARLYAAQLESYEGYVPDLKKKLSTKELKKFEENEKKIKQFR
jgi:transposase-like protein